MKIFNGNLMNIRERVVNLKPFAWPAPAAIATLIVIYALIQLTASGLVPTMYIVGVGLLAAALLTLSFFLAIKAFKGRKIIYMRFISVVLAVVVALVTGIGLYLFHTSTSTLDSLFKSEGSVKLDTSESFNVYISGIDTFGEIQTESRSDVNIVATVNPRTNKILLTTVPRDAYVKIALGGNDEYDKLTHAGNYGVESSMKTLANLLDVEIDAYVRINFTSFIESIDKLGGVTIDNPTEFTSYGEHFPAGNIQLDGKRALVYSRERKSLQGGDIDRGKNQQRVIQGVIDKVSSIRTLKGYNAVLEILGESIQTNMSNDNVRSLINKQLAELRGWSTESYSVTGKGQTGGLPSYAMPGAELYMYVLDESSVKEAKSKIYNISG